MPYNQSESIGEMFRRPLSWNDRIIKEEIESLKHLCKLLSNIIPIRIVDRSITIPLPSDEINKQSSVLGTKQISTVFPSKNNVFAIPDNAIEGVKISAILPMLPHAFAAREMSSSSFNHLLKTCSTMIIDIDIRHPHRAQGERNIG
jgi:hypothetical protein